MPECFECGRESNQLRLCEGDCQVKVDLCEDCLFRVEVKYIPKHQVYIAHDYCASCANE